MRRRIEIERFRRDPVGCFTLGRNWIHFCAHPQLWGVGFFGRPDRTDADALCRSLIVELSDGVPRHRSLVDARQLEHADTGAFAVLHEFARNNLERSRKSVSDVALLHPVGIEGAVAAGFYTAIGAPFRFAAFTDVKRAVEWLDDPLGESVVAEIEGVIAAARGTSPLITAIQAIVQERPANPDLDRICRSLGVSKRTLQRRLRDEGTTFQKELLRARVNLSERRLLDGTESLTALALDLGFASPQHFSRQFRQITGESPSDWRSRHRQAVATMPRRKGA